MRLRQKARHEFEISLGYIKRPYIKIIVLCRTGLALSRKEKPCFFPHLYVFLVLLSAMVPEHTTQLTARDSARPSQAALPLLPFYRTNKNVGVRSLNSVVSLFLLVVVVFGYYLLNLRLLKGLYMLFSHHCLSFTGLTLLELHPFLLCFPI